jgi:hypothetical protein
MANNPKPGNVNPPAMYREGWMVQLIEGLACPDCGTIARTCDVELLNPGLKLPCRNCPANLFNCEPT